MLDCLNNPMFVRLGKIGGEPYFVAIFRGYHLLVVGSYLSVVFWLSLIA